MVYGASETKNSGLISSSDAYCVREGWRGIGKKQAELPEEFVQKRRNRRRKNSPENLFPFQLTIKSKIPPLARQTDQSKKATCPTHLTGKEKTYSGL